MTRIAALILAATLLAAPAMARTKLVTLPDRAKLVLNLENPNHSLLYEEREVTLQKGTNHIDFSWQGVSIDPASIRLAVLSNPGEGDNATKIISVAFPPNENALTWQLYSPEARTERIRVSYLMFGIGRSISYEAVVNDKETEAVFQQYFQLSNQSGENMDDAAIRIAQAEDWIRSVDSGEVRKFLAYKNPSLPIEKVFVVRPAPMQSRGEDGEPIAMVYEFANAPANGLGKFDLAYGKTRFFAHRDDGGIFTGEDWLANTPVGEKAELKLGTVKDVLLKKRIDSDTLEPVKRNDAGRVVISNRKVALRYEIENFKDKPSKVRVIEQLPPDAKLDKITAPGVTVVQKSATEAEITIDLEPRPTDPKAKVPVKEVAVSYTIPNVLN